MPREGRTKDVMQVLFHKHVWLYSEYMPTLHWWTGASSVSPYVITIAWGIASDIIIRHWSNAYELFTYCALLIYFIIATVTITINLLLLLLLLLPLLPYYFATKYFAADIKFPGVVELTTQLLILKNIRWLPLCRIKKFGLNTLPSKTVAIPYTCGLSRLFSGAIAGEHSSILWVTWDLYLLITKRTLKDERTKIFPQLRGEVRNCHLAVHLLAICFE